jgi:hypothetical protein
VDPVNRGTAGISAGGEHFSSAVASTTLDRFAESEGIREIALLKMDIEGAEFLALSGAARLLRERVPAVVYYEVCPAMARRLNLEPAAATRILLDSGYRIHEITKAAELRPVGIEKVRDTVSANWVALR